MDITYIDLLKNLAAAVAGGVGTLLIAKIRNKTAYISFYWTSNRIALSANDSVFGDVRVTWQGMPVRNLHMFVFDVENTTTQDYENIDLRVYSDDETLILNEKTEVIGSPYTVHWSKEYQSRQYVAPETQPTAPQLKEHHHNREYNIPVFNRDQKLRLSYLCNRPNDDELPMLFIATPSRGIKLKLAHSPSITLNPIWGVPIHAAMFRALAVSIVVVVASAAYIDNVLTASAVCMFVGLTGQIFGAALFKVERFIRNLVSG
ncbi:MAG TPA: hypothetical protein VFP33_08155 [Gallionella sp.]|nr:hypothetical protein [Gallionella sp.]